MYKLIIVNSNYASVRVTVIGRKVNMAARLMMHYPEKITCDNETFHHSNIHKTNFQTLELKAMKGLQNVGTIREFTENRG